jgi:hypothetical protein
MNGGWKPQFLVMHSLSVFLRYLWQKPMNGGGKPRFHNASAAIFILLQMVAVQPNPSNRVFTAAVKMQNSNPKEDT